MQAECRLKHPRLYTILGGLLGACTAIARNGKNFRIWQYATRFCGWLAAGTILGGIVWSKLQSRKTHRVLETRTLHYFPEEYMQQVAETTQHGEDVYVHRLTDSPQVELGENEIRRWHDLASNGNSMLHHRHIKTGQLIANLPYYSPEARETYRGRGEELVQVMPPGVPPRAPAELNVPISYNQVQELNPYYSNSLFGSMDWQARISLPFAHSTKQDSYSCHNHPRTRLIGLGQLGATIIRGHIS